MELACILKSHLNLYILTLSCKVNDIMQLFNIFIQILYKTNNTLRLMILNMLCRITSFVLVYDCKLRIEICSLLQSVLYILFPESCLLKISGSGRKLILVPVFLVLPKVGSRPFSSSTTGTPFSYLSWWI